MDILCSINFTKNNIDLLTNTNKEKSPTGLSLKNNLLTMKNMNIYFSITFFYM